MSANQLQSHPKLVSVLRIVDKIMAVPFSNEIGEFLSGAYVTVDADTGVHAEHMLLYLRLSVTPCLLRINSACFTADIFGDRSCDCSWQLFSALSAIQKNQHGLLLYHLNDEGRGRGLSHKLREFQTRHRQSQYDPQPPSDLRSFESSILILKDLGIGSVKLISNSPHKQQALEQGGVSVVERLPIVSNDLNLLSFYQWKRRAFGHEL